MSNWRFLVAGLFAFTPWAIAILPGSWEAHVLVETCVIWAPLWAIVFAIDEGRRLQKIDEEIHRYEREDT